MSAVTTIEPLTTIVGTGTFAETSMQTDEGPVRAMLFVVNCRQCGDVTRRESGFTVDTAPIQQAGLYRQRHLSRHLTALASEMQEAVR